MLKELETMELPKLSEEELQDLVSTSYKLIYLLISCILLSIGSFRIFLLSNFIS